MDKLAGITERLIKSSIEFLYQNKWLTALFITIYFAGIIILHDPLVNVSVYVMNKMGLDTYNTFITVLTLVVSVIVGLFLFRQISLYPRFRKLKIISLIVIGILLTLHYIFLLEMNIEIIHSFAYSILAFLAFGLFKRFGAAMVFILPLMLIDEWYQYILLYPHYVEYWELNDILLNKLGVVFMFFIFFVCAIETEQNIRPFYKRWEFILLLAMALCMIIGVQTCYFATHESTQCEHTVFVMSKLENPELVWHTHPFTGKMYYILTPLESLIIFSGMCLFFIGLDSYFARKSGSITAKR